jgi:thymidylate kinase
VLFDRHFFADYYAHHVAANGRARTLGGRIHGFVLGRLYPKPDLMICLDAPAAVLFARKPESTVEALERRRQEYFAMRHLVRHFVVVDATRPEDEVTRHVAMLIGEFSRAGGRPAAAERAP